MTVMLYDYPEVYEYIENRVDNDHSRSWFDAATPLIEGHYTLSQAKEVLREYSINNIYTHNKPHQHHIMTGIKSTI